MSDFTDRLLELCRMESAAERLRNAASHLNHSKNNIFKSLSHIEANKLQKVVDEVNKFLNTRHI